MISIAFYDIARPPLSGIYAVGVPLQKVKLKNTSPTPTDSCSTPLTREK